jgi:3-deoxy-D-manno-octulosonic-acid transferase
MRLLYTLAIQLYGLIAHVLALFQPKAKLWIEGQSTWKSELKGLENGSRPIWFHCASVGEFEQARPIIEKINDSNPEIPILLTFFSPSGFELHKDYRFAKCVAHLPLDTPENAREFLDVTKPRAIVFVKYELWFNFIQAFSAQKIPSVLISAFFHNKHLLLRWPGRILGKNLESFTQVFVQDESTVSRLAAIGVNNTEVAGDTRYDRVLDIANEPFDHPGIDDFAKGNRVVVVGSNWPEDDEIIMDELKSLPKIKVIVAPHEMSGTQMNVWESKFAGKIIRLSELGDAIPSEIQILYIDRIGMLSRIYRYASVAYVGGGFGKSIHNALEPSVYGVPVLFGPNNDRFDEAQQLIGMGAGFEINDQIEFGQTVRKLLSDTKLLEDIKLKLSAHFERKKGGSAIILRWLNQVLEKAF